MPRILQAIKAIDIEMVGENLLLLNFKALSDKKRTLFEGPWNFFKVSGIICGAAWSAKSKRYLVSGGTFVGSIS